MSTDSRRETALRRLIDQLPAAERRLLTQRRARAGVDASTRLGLTLDWLRAAMLCEQPPPPPGGDSGEPEAGPVITVRAASAGVIPVRVAGEVDRDNAAHLRETLLDVVRGAAPGAELEIDLGAVPLLDAAGIAAVLAVHQAAQARGVGLALVAPQPFVRRVAVICGLAPLLRPDDAGAR